VIRAREIEKRFGAHEVLRGITLDVQRGEVAAIIGSSGSGKSTFLRCLNGLERMDAGTVEITGTTLRAGLDPALEQRTYAAIRARVGMVFQQFHLFPHLSVLGNVAEAQVQVARRPLAEARERSLAMLERVGLATKAAARTHTLSGGEQQRVAIARALAMEPEVLLCDEPTSALDPRMASEVLGVLSDLARDGLTMLVVTHAMSFARRVAQRVHVFHEGRVIESGPSEQVLESPREAATAALLETARL